MGLKAHWTWREWHCVTGIAHPGRGGDGGRRMLMFIPFPCSQSARRVGLLNVLWIYPHRPRQRVSSVSTVELAVKISQCGFIEWFLVDVCDIFWLFSFVSLPVRPMAPHYVIIVIDTKCLLRCPWTVSWFRCVFFILGFLFYFLFLDLKMLFIMAKLYVCVGGCVCAHECRRPRRTGFRQAWARLKTLVSCPVWALAVELGSSFAGAVVLLTWDHLFWDSVLL